MNTPLTRNEAPFAVAPRGVGRSLGGPGEGATPSLARGSGRPAMTSLLSFLSARDGADVARSLDRNVLAGVLVVALLLGVFAGWGMIVPLASAVVANGVVVVEGSLKRIQHPTGGIIGAIAVREGSRVEAGQLLLRLDETATRANLGVITNELTAHRVHLARLLAERNGEEEVAFPDDLVQRVSVDPEVAKVIASERSMFASELRNRKGLREQLRERIVQLKEEIAGLEAQRKALVAQGDLAAEEKRDVETLFRQKLVPRSRVSQLEREIIRIDGSVGDMTSRIAQSRGKISEVELQILQIDKERAADVAKAIRETETRVGELNERRMAAEDQLRRIEIRAPDAGTIHQLSAHTVGGVVGAGETIMQIVPDNEALVVEVRINPADIDHVRVGQKARVKFTAFNPRTTPEIMGSLSRVAADLTRDDKSGISYYSAAVRVTDEEIARLGGVRLQPGMPAEVFMHVRDRTFAEYLIEPITDRMARALREN